MALDFPASPSNGDTYAAPNGVLYTYDAVAGLWYVGAAGSVNTTDIVDGAVTTPKLASDIAITTTGNVSAVDGTFSGDLTAGTISGNSAGGGAVVGYQQGLWVPDVNSGAVSAYDAVWVRIGNQVTLKVGLGSWTSTDGVGIAIIGLPYNSHISQAAGSAMYVDAKPNYTTTYVTYSGTYNNGFMEFYNTIDSNNWDNLKFSNLNANAFFYLTATYFTDDTTWVPGNGATVS